LTGIIDANKTTIIGITYHEVDTYQQAKDIQNLLFSCGLCTVIQKSVGGYHVMVKPNFLNIDEYVFSKVVCVTDDVEEETYDIEVENNHQFFCEGYLVHNSAEIALGDPSDETFLNLKNWDDFPERSDISHLSNNTCVFRKTEDFELIPTITERIKLNGEPGFCNMININRYGRIRDISRDAWTREQEPDEATGCNPCSEIPLESGELCNIADIMLPRCREGGAFYEKLFERAIRHATFYCSTISLLPTHHGITNTVIAKNRRIGVALSGIAEFYTEVGFTRMTKYLRKGYKIVSQVNRQLAREAGVCESIRKTTVKPSGTISLLSGASAGMHFPTFKYAIRRVTVSKTAPINDILIANEVPYEESHWDNTSNIFEFLIDQGQTRAATEVSMWEQFQLLTTLQREWADNMVSATVYFNPETEGDQIEYCLAQNAPLIKSVSMFPHTDASMYKQAPYTGITRELYESRLSHVKPIDWSKLIGSDGVAPRYCNNDTCTL
jgi:ribonucleoside-diphosphate reductase alpha chain